MHSFIRQGGRSLCQATRHLWCPSAAPAQQHSTLLRRGIATTSVGHGKEGVAAAAAADWQRQQAAATPPASSAAAAAATPSALLPHLRQLSEEQLAAVTAPLGTVRVVAGPGSGKTRVLTARIVQLIHVHKAQPWQILAITFTNKAATEMRERLAAMLGEEAGKQLFAGTFHSLCYRILKAHIAELPASGRTSAFSVYDQEMSLRLLAREVRAVHGDWKAKQVNEKAAALQDAISRAKSGMVTWHAPTPQAVQRRVLEHLLRTAAAEGAPPGKSESADEVADWFGRYEAALRASNAADFDDLLGLAVALLRGSHELRQRYLRRFRHVLVDEFQDTNTAQYELVKLLTLPRADLLVVGDPDQAIYGWRGADMTNMTHAFAQDFPDAQVLDLRDNYRSCARIVATAQHVIAANDDWQRAALRPLRPPGHPIEVHVLRDSQEEARFVAAEIAGALARREHPPEQVAVLLRTHVQSRLVEQELVRRGVPYILVGGVPFWRRMEIQDVMAYLRLAVGLRDDVALARVINTPRRGVGDASLERLAAAAAAQGGTLCTLLFGDLAAGGSLPPLPDRKALGLTPKSAAALEAFRELVAGLAAGVRGQPLGQALEQIIAQTGYRQHVLEGGCASGTAKEGDARERLQRLDQLVGAATGYVPGELSGAAALDDAPESAGPPPSRLQLAQNFLDEAALYSGAEEGGGGARGVRLMTMHAAKGLEFDLVFVPGCNDGLVPLLRDESSPEALAEERRLFYVSLTRAKSRLRLTHTLETSLYGPQSRREAERSRFLTDVLQAGHAVLRGAEGAAPPPPARHAAPRSTRAGPVAARRGGGGAQAGRSSGSGGSSGSSSSRQEWTASSSSSRQSGGGSRSASSSSQADSLRPPAAPPLSAAQEKARKRGGRR